MRSETTREHIQNEFLSRIKAALQLRDWNQLEIIAQDWIQTEMNSAQAMKWLARASLAKNNISRAAYAYQRILDLDSRNSEAKNFFENYPSALQNNSERVGPQAPPVEQNDFSSQGVLLTPDQRRQLSQQELVLAQLYEEFQMPFEAAERFLKSFEWQGTQEAALGVGRCYHKSRQSLEAQKFLRKQIENFPQWNEGRLLLAKILLESNYTTEAQRIVQSLLAQDPTHKEAFQLLQFILSVPRL